MAFNFRGSSVPDGSITNAKLADGAVSTNKIQNDAVTTDKVTADIGIQHFLGFEGTFAHTGTTETTIGEFNFTKSSTTTESWKSLGTAITLQSNDSGNTATVNVYIDSVLFVTDGTTSTTPVFLEDDAIDITSLSVGNHFVEVKLVNSQVTGIATLSKLDVYLGKKAV